MPYEIKKSGEGYKVFKKGTSKSFSKSYMSKEKAEAQLKALYANADEGKTNTMKKSELREMIAEIIKEVMNESSNTTPKHIIIAQLMGPDFFLSKKPESKWDEKDHELFNRLYKMASETGSVPKMTESIYHGKKVKIVLSGGDVEKKHDRIILTLKKIDPETTIKYFDASKQIVGTFSNKLVKAINTNLRSLNINDVKVEVK